MIIRVRVKPKSKKEEVRKLSENSYEVRVKEPPEKGKANERVRELVAEYFSVPKSNVRIVKGVCSREKVLEIGLET